MFSPLKKATTAVSKTFRSLYMREREVSAIKMSQGPFPLIPRQKKTAAAFEMSHQKRREKTGKGKCDRRRGAKRDIFCPHKMEREKDLDEEKFSLLEVPIYPTKISALLFWKMLLHFQEGK